MICCLQILQKFGNPSSKLTRHYMVNNKIEGFDLDQVLGGLKDFQRKTVEYVFRRMFIDDIPSPRFLVADEVGLGKTLVARGVIAKTIDHLRQKGDRIDVIYICSNADIARQNVKRLSIPGFEVVAQSTRLTLLPLQLKNILKHRV